MLTLPARLTHADAQPCIDGCLAALSSATQGQVVDVDASALREFDSSALSVLLSVRRAAQARGADLKIHGLSARLRGLSALYGVDELLPE